MTVAFTRPDSLATSKKLAPPASRALRWTRAVLVWERAIPLLFQAGTPFALLLLAALFGLFQPLSPIWRQAALVATLAASIALAWRAARGFRRPTLAEAMRRLEADNNLTHAPLFVLADAPFGASSQHPLWRAALAEARARIARLLWPRPRTTFDAVDPFALRSAAALLFVVALVAAGDTGFARLAALVAPDAKPRAAGGLVDAWIEPPAYTGLAPIFLIHGDDKLSGLKRQIDAPQGAKLIAQGPTGLALSFRTEKGEITRRNARSKPGLWAGLFGGKHAPDTDDTSAADRRLTIPLERSGLLTLSADGDAARWPIGVKIDTPPTIALTGPVEISDDGKLALPATVDDDYGVVDARLEMRLAPGQKRPLDAPPFDAATLRAVHAARAIGAAGKSGPRRLIADIAAEPWAGLEVFAKAIVVDGAGQIGASEEVKLRLPKRRFENSLARAVLEERQKLAVAPSKWPETVRAFDAMTLAPERFYDQSKDYLLMRAGFWRLAGGGGRDLDKTVSDFWTLALNLENAELAEAKRQFEAARDALKDAIAKGASEAEIRQKLDALRAAVSAYLDAVAKAGPPPEAGGQEAVETLAPEEVNDRLSALQNLAEQGAKGAAGDALDDLSALLENLRGASSAPGKSSSSPPSQGARGSSSASAVSDLIGRQRDLADRTAERAKTGGAGDDLAADNKAIEQQLDQLMKQAGPNSRARPALDAAARAMREAESALRAGSFGAAETAMEAAIENLRAGAGELAKEDRARSGASGGTRDPLGRPLGPDGGAPVGIPEKINAERARELREELRRRISKGGHSEEEIRYIERLLERF